ncbi:MAG: hypothetical protein RR482_05390, partial [Clostridia bacterium]
HQHPLAYHVINRRRLGGVVGYELARKKASANPAGVIARSAAQSSLIASSQSGGLGASLRCPACPARVRSCLPTRCMGFNSCSIR